MTIQNGFELNAFTFYINLFNLILSRGENSGSGGGRNIVGIMTNFNQTFFS